MQGWRVRVVFGGLSRASSFSGSFWSGCGLSVAGGSVAWCGGGFGCCCGGSCCCVGCVLGGGAALGSVVLWLVLCVLVWLSCACAVVLGVCCGSVGRAVLSGASLWCVVVGVGPVRCGWGCCLGWLLSGWVLCAACCPCWCGAGARARCGGGGGGAGCCGSWLAWCGGAGLVALVLWGFGPFFWPRTISSTIALDKNPKQTLSDRPGEFRWEQWAIAFLLSEH